MIVCMLVGYKKNKRVFTALKNNECKIILSSIANKSYRRIGARHGSYRIDFYECPEYQGEINPCSSQQYEKAKVGDPLKVVILPKPYKCYGIVITDNETNI